VSFISDSVHVVSDTENDANIPVSDSLSNVNKSIEHERDNVPYAYHLVNGQNLNATEMLASILDTEKHVVQNIPDKVGFICSTTMSVPRTTIICQIAVFRVLSHGYIVGIIEHEIHIVF
jgi:glycerol-3-phosphate dehydrogenase